MLTRRRAALTFIVCGVLALLASLAAVAQTPSRCDATATPSSLSSVFAATSSGTICLSSGTYAGFRGGMKTSEVTLRPAEGAQVTMSFLFSPASHVTLDGIQNITRGEIGDSPTNHITVRNSYFSGNMIFRTGQLANSDVLFDHNTHGPWNFPGGSACGCAEGRVWLPNRTSQPSGITIRNSRFGPGGDSDGIQNGSRGTVIENNEFAGLRQGSSSVHVDPIQLYGSAQTIVRRNWIHDNQVAASIMAPDDLDHELFEDNVMSQPPGADTRTLNIGGDNGTVVRHNTFIGRVTLKPDKRGVASRTAVFQDNIVTAGMDIQGGSTITTRSHNLGARMNGLMEISGQPTFVASVARPTTFEGHRLADSSLGRGNASDALDRGARLGAPSPPPDPDSTPPPDPDSTPTPPPDIAANASWTATPASPHVREPVSFDGTKSTGDAPLACRWDFTNSTGSTVYQSPRDNGCKFAFVQPEGTGFSSTGTKYLRLRVTDADGDTDTDLHSLMVQP